MIDYRAIQQAGLCAEVGGNVYWEGRVIGTRASKKHVALRDAQIICDLGVLDVVLPGPHDRGWDE